MRSLFFNMKSLQENYLLPCAYKTLFGINCPICGFQRALLLLLHGQFVQSFKMYPPLLPCLFLLAFFVLHLLNKRLIKRTFLVYYSVIVLATIVVSYAYGNLLR